MDWFLNDLKTHPELAFFLTLAIGYAVAIDIIKRMASEEIHK